MSAQDEAQDEILRRLRRFRTEYFPRFKADFARLVAQGQQPKALFIGCSDSRVMPHELTGADPGGLFVVRNIGNIVPPYRADQHATAAAIEFAVLVLGVPHIIVCGHTHCGAMQALYHDSKPGAEHLREWLEYAREAALPVRESPEVLRRTEQRGVMMSMERLMEYPMVAERVERGALALHGWHYILEEGRVLTLDIERDEFTDIAAEGATTAEAPFKGHE